jgi:REP element-mobilizing transposase RayT
MSNSTPLEPGCIYHIFNRGINGSDIFFDEQNYHYFLRLYAEHISPVAATFAYCLLKNHFHFLLQINEVESTDKTIRGGLSKVSQSFADFFKAYTLGINKSYQRTGSLIERPFHRKPIASDAHLSQAIVYIHLNPQKHGLVDDFHEWPHSSYRTLIGNGQTRLSRNAVLNFFGGREQMIAAHEITQSEKFNLDEF